MKLKELLIAQPVLQQIMDRKMPAKLAYALAKNTRLINSELEDYNKTRLKILSDNWTLNSETNKYDIPDEDQERWDNIHQELLDSDCGYEPYKISMGLAAGIDWTPGEFVSLWFIFDNED